MDGWKMDGWKTSFLLGWLSGRCYVSFRECSMWVFFQRHGFLRQTALFHEVLGCPVNQWYANKLLPFLMIFTRESHGFKQWNPSRNAKWVGFFQRWWAFRLTLFAVGWVMGEAYERWRGLLNLGGFLDDFCFSDPYWLGLPPTQDSSHHQDYYIFSRESL